MAFRLLPLHAGDFGAGQWFEIGAADTLKAFCTLADLWLESGSAAPIHPITSIIEDVFRFHADGVRSGVYDKSTWDPMLAIDREGFVYSYDDIHDRSKTYGNILEQDLEPLLQSSAHQAVVAETGRRARETCASCPHHGNGYQEFLSRWRAGGGGAAPLLRQSTAGNRNLLGSAMNTAAYSYARGQQGFSDSIEPRIRPLVLYLVEAVGLVTYSSCEGHLATASSPFRPAHVGVLPGASAEPGLDPDQQARRADAVTRWLMAAAQHTMCQREEPALGVRAVVDVLDTDRGPQTCMDVWFLPIHGTPGAYFSALPALIEDYQRALARLRASREAADPLRA